MRSILFTAFTLLFPLAFSITCRDGFSVINNSRCVKIFPNQLKHGEAETDCRYLGGTLVNIKNSIDNRMISSIAANGGIEKLWIGTYCFATQNGTRCYYDDNSGEVVYSNFLSGFPNVDGAYGGCVYLFSAAASKAGKWISAKCEVEEMPFVCEVPPTFNDNKTCKYNYNGYCYYPSTEITSAASELTFDEAQKTCSSLYTANLASIHSMRELDYVKSLFRGTSVSQITLGAFSTLPEIYNWVDGSKMEFTYMFPRGKTGVGNCLKMDFTNYGLWTEIGCTMQNSYLCKRPASMNQNTNTVEKISPQPEMKTIVLDPYDFSHCNSTFFLAPGVITSAIRTR